MILTKSIWIIGLGVLLLVIPRLTGLVADVFDYSRIDPDGAYAWISVHHLVQAMIVLVIMVIITRRRGIHFGFGWGDRQVGWKWVRIFALIFAVYVLVSLLLVMATGTFQFFPYPPTALNVTGQLGFQLLLSGPSEELIFRAFAITILALWLKGGLFRGTLSYASIIAAIIFALAHVGIGFEPFTLSYNPFQLIYAFALGLAYGACYEQSKSIYYPMMMHSLSNVVAVAVSIIAVLWYPPLT